MTNEIKSREIKFRVWDKKNAIMAQVCSIHNFNYPDNSEYKYIATGGKGLIQWEDAILMQYTGLKDKNGKEIYEGDIVRYLHKYKPDPIYAEVRWFNQHANFALYENTSRNIYDHESDWMILKDIEVIGNIYQNPELLTTK